MYTEDIKNFEEASSGALGKLVVKGGLWVMMARSIQLFLYIFMTVVLARLLSPKDFGVFGIALLVLSMLNTFSQTGFSQALIQKKEDIGPYLDTVWTAGVIRGFLIAGVIFAASDYIAIFFRTPEAALLLKTIGLVAVFQGLTNVAVVYFDKELDFKKSFLMNLTGAVFEAAVALTIAVIFRNVWALVMGCLVSSFIKCAVSHMIVPYRPKLEFNASKAKELFGYGKWLMGSSIVIFFLIKGDDILVGKVLGATALGFYQMAYAISNLPATEITELISRVTFPAYARIQDDMGSLRKACFATLKLSTFLTFPVLGFIFSLGPYLVNIFLGAKWLPIVPAVEVLCFFGIVRCMNGVMASFFPAVGHPRIITIVAAFQLILLAATIYPLTVMYGIVGTSLSIFLPAALVLVYLFRKLATFMQYDIPRLLKMILPQFLGMLFMVLIANAIKMIAIGIGDMAMLMISLVLCGCGYVAIFYAADRVLKTGTAADLSRILGLIRQSLKERAA